MNANLDNQLLSMIASRFPGSEPLTDIEAPEWPRAERTWGDWKQYLSPELRAIWSKLGIEAQLACYFEAMKRADYER